MNMAIVRSFVTDLHKADANLFALFDPLAELPQDNPLQLELLRGQLGNEAVIRILRPDLAHTPDLCPALVTLAGPGSQPTIELLKVLADHLRREAYQEKRYVCGLLSSSADAEEVASHVLSLGYLPAKQGSLYFPVHEPLRLELLSAGMKSDEQSNWWPIEHWLYPDSNGASKVISATAGEGNTPDEFAASVQVDAPLVAALLRAWRRTPKPTSEYTHAYAKSSSPLPEHAAALAYSQIQQARIRGLILQQDVFSLALLQLTVHPQLQRHPQINSLIDSAIARKILLQDLFRSYSDSDWDRIVSDLIQTGTQP